MARYLRVDLVYRLLWMAALAAIGAILYLVVYHHLQANVNHGIEATAEEVVASVRLVRMPDGAVSASFSRDLDSFENAGTHVQIIDGQGQPRSRDAAVEQPSLPAPEDAIIQRVLAGEEIWQDVSVRGTRLRVLYQPLRVQDQTLGVLQVAASLDDVDQTSRLILYLILAAVALGAIVGGSPVR